MDPRNSKKFRAPRTKEIFGEKLVNSKNNPTLKETEIPAEPEKPFKAPKPSEFINEITKSRPGGPKVLMGGHPIDFIPTQIKKPKKPTEQFQQDSPAKKKPAKEEKSQNRHSVYLERFYSKLGSRIDDNFVEIVGNRQREREQEFTEQDLQKELLGKMKLEEMISLNYTKSSNGGIIKKMLHAPTMTLYAVKEMPLESKASRDSLKYIMDNWFAKFAETSRLVNVYSCAYNHPEGCASIIMEYMNGGSLHSLLDTAMMLTEKVTKKIVWSVLHAIDAIHSNDLYHGGIKDSQILLTRDGRIKLNIGLNNRINRKSRMGVSSKEKKDIQNQQRQDLFDLGMLVQLCMTGDVDWLVGSDTNIDEQKELISSLNNKDDFVSTLAQFFDKRSVSWEMRDFIELCIVSQKGEISSKIQMNHPLFVKENSDVGANNISIVELIKISNFWNNQNNQNDFSKEQFKRICEIVDMILNNSSSWLNEKNQFFLNDILHQNERTPAIRELAYDLGLSKEFVLKYLKRVVESVPAIKNLRKTISQNTHKR